MNEDFKWFTSEEMSNDFYHSKEDWPKDYVSGSDLGKIFAECPAAWFFSEKEETHALKFGTESHTNFESKSLFEKTYRRAPKAEEIKDVITSQTALASKLKSFGLTGTSGKQYPELIKMMVDCGENLNVMWLIDMIAESQARADGVELINADDYDSCIAMRNVLEMIPEHRDCMNSPTAQREMSIFGVINGVKVKVRLDHTDICNNPIQIEKWGFDPLIHPEVVVITDYKTTRSANPSEFGTQVARLGYLLKMALQRDLFKKLFNEKRPIVVRLLAQESKPPYLPLAFRLTDRQLSWGRDDYMSVIHTYQICKETNVWPSYANGEPEVELTVPEWYARRYEPKSTN